MKRFSWTMLYGVLALAVVISLGYFAWAACRNPSWAAVLNGARSCPEFWFNRYQGLFGALIALIAAIVAVRPVWRQLMEMKRQSDHIQYDQMRKRSLELNAEENLIYGVTAAASNLAEAFTAFGVTREKMKETTELAAIGLQAAELDLLKAHSDYFDAEVQKFSSGLGPLWGSEKLQAHRQSSLEAAQRFSVRFNKYLRTLTLGGPVPFDAIDAAARDLVEYKDSLFTNAVAVHTQIESERTRIGRLIARSEQSLLVD